MDRLKQFKDKGTGVEINEQLIRKFPLFDGKAPIGHPYPQAFVGGPTDTKYCFVQNVDGNVLLSRRLTDGRIINIDTYDCEMLNGGLGIAHVNMNNCDNRIANLRMVTEEDAREMLLEFDTVS